MTCADLFIYAYVYVSDPAADSSLCFGESGILEGISPGKSLIDVSMIGAEITISIHNAIKKKGCRFLEAPVLLDIQIKSDELMALYLRLLRTI